mmetsp:Transcript_31834/g.85019  ORF Transcript_31834/g.85019 Transcript_31834/m.85019 type:complete len:86 (+) Transcript_31834:651-908(+)
MMTWSNFQDSLLGFLARGVGKEGTPSLQAAALSIKPGDTVDDSGDAEAGTMAPKQPRQGTWRRQRPGKQSVSELSGPGTLGAQKS